MFKKIMLSAGLAIVLFLASAKNVALVSAQYAGWSVPERVPGLSNFLESPYMFADSNGNVHAFNSQYVDGKVSIVYSKWDYEHGWTLPVDILLPARGEAQIKGALLDKRGIAHLVYAVGDQYGGEVLYTNAPIQEAGRASAWSTPSIIGKDANMFATAIAGDDDGNLYVFYGGTLEGNGLYEVHSQDYGQTWSEPETVFLTNGDDLVTGSVGLLMDDNNELHIAWSNWNPPIGAQDLYYSRLDIKTDQRTEPVRLSGGGADTPTMIKYKDTLYLIYATGGIANGTAGKAMRQSSDGGRNWTNPVWAFPPAVGGNGPAALVIDSQNRLHALLANRTGDCCHGVWYSTWEGNQWSKIQAIIKGPKTPEFDPYSPHAVISQGNVILVTWWNESHNNGIWYSFAKLNAPELPLVPLPTPVATSTPGVSVSMNAANTVEPSPAPQPVRTLPPDNSFTSSRSPTELIMLGVFPLLILVTLVILWRTRR